MKSNITIMNNHINHVKGQIYSIKIMGHVRHSTLYILVFIIIMIIINVLEIEFLLITEAYTS